MEKKETLEKLVRKIRSIRNIRKIIKMYRWIDRYTYNAVIMCTYECGVSV